MAEGNNLLDLEESPESRDFGRDDDDNRHQVDAEPSPKQWLATVDNPTTRRLKLLLAKHEQTLDPRFASEGDLFKERKDQRSLYDVLCESEPILSDTCSPTWRRYEVDFWSSTEYRKPTSRAERGEVVIPKMANRRFYMGDIVIFVDPMDNHGKRECTGRVLKSPYDARSTIAPPEITRSGPHLFSIVRRTANNIDHYTVEQVSRRIVPGLLMLESHEETRFVEKYCKRKRPRKRSNQRTLLLTINQIESPWECRCRKLTNVVKNWILRFMSAQFGRWKDFLTSERLRELRDKQATVIQGFWRSVLAKRMTLEKQIAARLMMEQRQKEIERQRQMEIKRKQEEEHRAYLRKHGVTRDGVRFFLTQEELEAFYQKQERLVSLLEKAFDELSSAKMCNALERWRYYIHQVLPPPHLDIPGLSKDVGGLKRFLLTELEDQGEVIVQELGDLSRKLKEVADRQAKRTKDQNKANALITPWHPAVKIRLPVLPNPGARLKNDGSIELYDLARFKNFKTTCSGPTDNSSWLFRGAYAKALFGGYPSGQARRRSRKVTSRSSAIAALLTAGINTFVCLMTKEELEAAKSLHDKNWLFAREAVTWQREIRKELVTGVNACKEALEFAETRLSRAREIGYGKSQMDSLEFARANRAQDTRKAQSLLDNFPSQVKFLVFPLPRNAGLDSDDFKILQLVKEIELRLRHGDSPYIFSAGGSGRAGMVASVLLGRLYGLTPLESMEFVQRCQDAQERFHGVKIAKSCPKTIQQRSQVARVLQHTEPCYDSNIARTQLESEQVVSLRETKPVRRNEPLKF